MPPSLLTMVGMAVPTTVDSMDAISKLSSTPIVTSTRARLDTRPPCAPRHAGRRGRPRLAHTFPACPQGRRSAVQGHEDGMGCQRDPAGDPAPTGARGGPDWADHQGSPEDLDVSRPSVLVSVVPAGFSSTEPPSI